jgi:hypothetical protein
MAAPKISLIASAKPGPPSPAVRKVPEGPARCAEGVQHLDDRFVSRVADRFVIVAFPVEKELPAQPPKLRSGVKYFKTYRSLFLVALGLNDSRELPSPVPKVARFSRLAIFGEDVET